MRRIAFFVEGLTEQLFLIKFIEEVRKLISVFFLIFYLKMNDHELIKLKKELQRKQELLKE